MQAFVGNVLVNGNTVPCAGIRVEEKDRLGTELVARSAIDTMSSLNGPHLPSPGESGFMIRELSQPEGVPDTKVLEDAKKLLGERIHKPVAEAHPVPLEELVKTVGADAIRGVRLNNAVAELTLTQAS